MKIKPKDIEKGLGAGNLAKIFLGSIFLVLFLNLSILIDQSNWTIHHIDLAVNGYAVTHQSAALTPIMYAITSLGNPGEIVFIVMGLLVIFMIARRWQIAACLGLGFLLTSSVTEYAKNFFRIARPNMPYATSVGNWSFPSGHTTGTTIVFLIVAFGLVAIIRNKALKVSCASLCGLIIFLVGISRIYIGVHWLSDVIGGWLFAGGIGLIVLGCAAMISSLLARFRFRRI